METITSKMSPTVSQNLDLYADGDEDFRQELKELLIRDLCELRNTVEEQAGMGGESLQKLNKAVHKMKVSLDIVASAQFDHSLEQLLAAVAAGDASAAGGWIKLCRNLCDDFIKALECDPI